ncbi:EF-Tu/IF-2/RF-3 family GTPase [Streptomyces sp. NPDC005573]|uniref:EF-Tu/IF-2/RF-3 family GTPase n=1 Tax=Streptomyces sp. NPDC005573 TaxID=3156890 RepID=UPI0033B484DB
MDATGEPFLLWISDVFRRRPGRPVLVVGHVERGSVREGHEVMSVGSGTAPPVRVAGIEHDRVNVDEAAAGMHVGILLSGTGADAVRRGQVLATPGSIRAHTVFTADLAPLSEEQGGADVVSGDRLCFHVGTAAVTGTVVLHGPEVLRPLHAGEVTVTLEEPVALEEGGRFAFRHHGRAAGSGAVTRLLR